MPKKCLYGNQLMPNFAQMWYYSLNQKKNLYHALKNKGDSNNSDYQNFKIIF